MARYRIEGTVNLDPLPAGVPAGPTFVAANVQTFAFADPWVVSRPAASTNGHLLVAAFVIPSGRFLALPAGWKHVSGSPTCSPSNDAHMFVMTKVVSGDPFAYSFDWVPDGSDGVGAILAYTGFNVVAPVNDARGSGYDLTATPTSPAIDPSVDHCTVLALYGTDQLGPVTWTPPSGYVERVDASDPATRSSLHVAEKRFAAAERVSPQATVSVADEGVAFTVALAPD